MTDRFQGRLSEFLDGELAPEEAALIERHLAECEACAATLSELEAVTRRARDLPPREPPRDLWGGIETRIREGAEAEAAPAELRRARRRISFSVPQLAAAAVTLASLSAGVAWLAGSRGADESGADAAVATGTAPTATLAASPSATSAEALAPAEYYAASIQALEDVLFDSERPLPPETEARVRRALMIIDGAIEDARAALEEMPEDPYLREHVTSTLRRKTEFLRGAVRMAAQS